MWKVSVSMKTQLNTLERVDNGKSEKKIIVDKISVKEQEIFVKTWTDSAFGLFHTLTSSSAFSKLKLVEIVDNALWVCKKE